MHFVEEKNTSGYITIVRMFFLFLLHYISEKSEYVDQYAKRCTIQYIMYLIKTCYSICKKK